MCASYRDHSSYAPGSLQKPACCVPLLDAEFRNPGRRSVGPRMRVIVVRPPQRREVPAEVQFEVARNPVTDAAELSADDFDADGC
jgi:hypothetical protein